MENSFSKLLWTFSKTIIDVVQEHQAQGKLDKVPVPYKKRKIENFKYERTSRVFHSSIVDCEREEISFRMSWDFMDNVIKKMPEYSECVSCLKKADDGDLYQEEQCISSFAQYIFDQAVNGEVSDEDIVDGITMFVRDLDQAPREWDVEVWLESVWVEEDLNLDSEYNFRRPRQSDLEFEFNEYVGRSFNPTQCMPDFILEFKAESNNNQDVEHISEAIVDVLRIYELGSVRVLYRKCTPKSVLGRPAESQTIIRYESRFKYELDESKVGELGKFLERMKPIMLKMIKQKWDREQKGYIGIAFQRYKDALLEPYSTESCVTSAITCLEALLLKANERAELSHRLGQRMGMLLRFFGFQSLKVYKDIIQAYSIRSTFVHGGEVSDEKEKFASEIYKQIMEYVRVVIIIFLQIESSIEKESLICKLDNAMLDENALSKLKDQISEFGLLIP